MVLAPALAIVAVSWARAMASGGQESLAARNAEWMRDHHLGFVVDRVEQAQAGRDQPPDGGSPARVLLRRPRPAPGSTTRSTTPTTLPPPMPSPTGRPLPGEGAWVPLGGSTGGVEVTRVRPNARKTSLLVFVARIDPRRATVRLVPGTQLPGGTWSHPPRVTPAECRSALLVFNGGFRFDQSGGGWYDDGRVSPNAPLRVGAASLVTFADGSVDVGVWGRDELSRGLAGITAVRQNLQLLVDGGHVAAGIDDAPKWGARLRNSLFIWRSGYGVTAGGDLVYVGGPGLTPRDLAERLLDAGAVRGMQGDINPEWVAANLIHHDARGCHGTKGLDASPSVGGQQSSGNRYLAPDTRDFVEVLDHRGA